MKYSPATPKSLKGASGPGEVILAAIITVTLLALFLGLVVTIGWNYGISEVIALYGGPSHTINVFQGFAVGLFLACIGGSQINNSGS